MDQSSLKAKINRVFKAARGVDIILLANTNTQDPNFIFMTDFKGGLYEDSFLVIGKKAEIVFTDMREYEGAKKQASNIMKVVELKDKKSIDFLIANVKKKRVGINGGFMPYRRYMRIKEKWKPKKLLDVTDALSNAREIKENYELERIKVAAEITKKAIHLTQKHLKVGITEKEAANYFNDLVIKLGADGLAFDSIVSFGSNTAIPHHSPDSTRLRYGDFVLMDVGAKFRNYCSDITRTTLFGTDKKRIKDYEKKMEIINTVSEAQKRAIGAIKEGANGGKIHMIAQNYIDKFGGGRYKGTMGHALGHSIGVEVHDGFGRFLSPKSTLTLKSGMVTSVEPGIYLPGFGGARKEDDLVITKSGCRIL